ncbi:MAG: glycoside hydrolase family 3 protein [Candidatus Aminicenantales bacterium]
MKRRTNRFALAVFAAGGLLASGCVRAPAPAIGPALSSVDSGWVSRTLKRMTLEEKIGQMVFPRYPGVFVNRDSDSLRGLETLIRESHIGGLLVAAGEANETAYLLNHLQQTARIPLLVASDLERGAGNQVGGATLFPPLMGFGAAGSEELAESLGRITAREGRALGIHLTCAPVADVNINPANPIINVRSVGEDPELVGRIAAAFIRGCQSNGMIAAVKHFPGHGDTAQDSHHLIPTVGGDRQRLESVELPPFRRAVEAGVRAVMTAHLAVPAVDPAPGIPATFSPVVVTKLLRDDLVFRGLILTDALNMGAVVKSFSPESAAELAVLAGADILLLPPDPAGVVRNLAAAVRSGKIPISRIEASARRILEAKASLGLDRNRLVDPESLSRSIAPREFLEEAGRAFERSATLVRNEGGILPLPRSGQKVAVISLSSDPGDYFAGRVFAAEMKKRIPALQEFFADGDTGQESLDAAAQKASEADAVVFALFSSLQDSKGSVDLDPRHAALVNKIAAGRASVTVVSFGSPYFLTHFPEADAYLCLWRGAPRAQETAVRVLFGEIDVSGRLPVSLPGLYPAGHGLDMKKNPPIRR